MYRGKIKIILLFVFIIVLMGLSAMIFSFEQDPQEIKDQVYDMAKEKVESEKDGVVDKIAETGREKVGETLQDLGERVLTQEYDEPGYFGDHDQSIFQKYDQKILFFTAEWCPSCKDVEEDIVEKRSYIPPHIAIMKIDFDDQEMRERYSVHKQHTFIFLDEGGEEIRRWTNSATLSDIISNTK